MSDPNPPAGPNPQPGSPQPGLQPPGPPQPPGQNPQQPGFPQAGTPQAGQAHPQQPPPGYLRLHLQGNMFLSMVTPSVQIDGYPAPAKYGENVLPVAPGRHVVSAHAQWMWKYGRAQHEIEVQPGQAVDVWYAAPLLTFIDGNMGPTKQKMRGAIGLLILLAVIVIGIILIILLVSLAS